MSEMIDLTNTDLGVENLGEMWSDFILRCTPEQAKLFNESYNLITISFPDSYIDSTLTHLFIDESMDTSDLMAAVRELFINTVIDALQIMGIIIDKDYVEMNSLSLLNQVLDTIYLADGITDLIGLADLLNYEDWTAKDRFIGVMKMISPENDYELLDYIVSDVSINTIRGLLVGINVIDEDDKKFVDPQLTKRVKANKPLLLQTLAFKHINDGGGLGQNIDTYLNLFINDLGTILMEGAPGYMKHVLGLMIISNLTDAQIHKQFNTLSESLSMSIEDLYVTNKVLEGAVLDA